MKTAIASDDQSTLARHFGRTKGFVIIETHQGAEVSRVYRPNTFTHHAHSGHQHEGGHDHSHAGILEALSDCAVVVAGGMGRRLYDELRSADKQVYLSKSGSVDEALADLLSGTLDDNANEACLH
ncbi:MAG: hypothetical protein KDK39_11830 [Leptospiraceae bacterium]|nr:hypothetical protein [Leptospiraceae bacterium]